jgi:hypothetical protein
VYVTPGVTDLMGTCSFADARGPVGAGDSAAAGDAGAGEPLACAGGAPRSRDPIHVPADTLSTRATATNAPIGRPKRLGADAPALWEIGRS